MAQQPDSDGNITWTLERVVTVLMQEMADMNRELRGDMAMMKQELKADIQKLSIRMDGLDRKFDALNLKVDRNHIAFMTNQRELEGRVAVLERK